MMRIALFVVLSFGAVAPLHAATLKICLTVDAYYTDCGRVLEDGTTDDYLNSPAGCSAGVPVKADGALFEVRAGSAGGTLLWSGNLGDGIGSGDPGRGCTSNFTVGNVNSTFYYKVTSRGVVQGNAVSAINGATGNNVTLFGVRTSQGLTSPAVLPLNTASSIDLNQAIWSGYLGAAFALYRHSGGMTETYVIDVDAERKTNSANASGARLSVGGARRKYTLVHEVGHMIADYGGFLRGGCDDLNLTGVCAAHEQQVDPKTTLRHSMGSKEVQTCAFSEAWGHFYAADVWNSHSDEECSFSYYKRDILESNESCSSNSDCETGSTCLASLCYAQPVVDCRPGSGLTCSGSECTHPARAGQNYGYALRHLEQTCGGSFDDRGSEVDWLRTFWTVHTRGSSPPSFTRMREWMSASFAFLTSGTPYVRIDYEANKEAGSLKDNWNYAKSRYGVDHQ